MLRTLFTAAAIAASSSWVTAFAAEWLFVGVVPSSIGGRPAGGVLYRIDLPSGKPERIGPIAVGGAPIAVTGLADQPNSGTIYGITTDDSPNHPRSLVTIDPRNASATVVGPLGFSGSDIAFDKGGKLFIWLRETSQVGTVSLETGQAHPVGPTKAAGEPGGIAIDASGRVFVVTSGATGSLDQIDSVSGRARRGPALQGALYPAGINAISISADGRIFALNSNRGVPAKSALVRIDADTGAVTKVSDLPDDADALVHMEIPWSAAEFFSSATGVSLVGGILALVVVLVVVLRTGRRRSS